jgi:hypothetical protein
MAADMMQTTEGPECAESWHGIPSVLGDYITWHSMDCGAHRCIREVLVVDPEVASHLRYILPAMREVADLLGDMQTQGLRYDQLRIPPGIAEAGELRIWESCDGDRCWRWCWYEDGRLIQSRGLNIPVPPIERQAVVATAINRAVAVLIGKLMSLDVDATT